MTIHGSHPFRPPEGDRDPVRRLRGRLAAPVTLWAAGAGRLRVGWTVSSVLVAEGDPAEVLGLLDPDADLTGLLEAGTPLTMSVLAQGQEFLAEAFAGREPAPGGPFTVGSWTDSPWGPVLAGTAGWIGARVLDVPRSQVGWGVLVRAVIEHAEPLDAPPLTHLRGTYGHVVAGRPR